MAVARFPIRGESTGLKIALIVCVCVSVAALTFMVIFLTQQADLEAAITDREQKAKQADQTMRQTREQMSDLARIVIGDPTDDPTKIKQEMAKVLRPIFDDAAVQKANIPRDSAILTVLQELYTLFAANVEALNTIQNERDKLNEQLSNITKAAKERDASFEQKVNELVRQNEELARAGEKNHQEWDRQMNELKAKLDKVAESAGVDLNKERENVRKLQETLGQKENRIKELLAELASFRPSATDLSVIQIADGKIIRALAGEEIVYISLGRKEGIKPGITFAVYSPIRGIPPDGKGKAAIEVTQPFDTTSECRVTMITPGDPIMEGDVIANPVFDRSRQFNFNVAGDFDLDFDGKIDDPAGEQVSRLIEQWGGKLVSTVDTQTDFVVLGAAPPLPVQRPAGMETDETRERDKERSTAREKFDAIKEEAKALSIPILTRTQFLHFLGFDVPVNVPEDEPAL